MVIFQMLDIKIAINIKIRGSYLRPDPGTNCHSLSKTSHLGSMFLRLVIETLLFIRVHLHFLEIIHC